jgi:hypothetical protein
MKEKKYAIESKKNILSKLVCLPNPLKSGTAQAKLDHGRHDNKIHICGYCLSHPNFDRENSKLIEFGLPMSRAVKMGRAIGPAQ